MKLWHALALALLGAILLWIAPIDSWLNGNFSFLSTLAHGVAEALVIAVFLAVTVDKFVKRQLADEIVKDVSPHVASASLPRGVREEIHSISTIQIYREYLESEYIIEQDPQLQHLVGVTTTTTFSIKNLSTDAIKFIFEVEVEKKHSLGKQQHIKWVKAENVWSRADKSPADYEENATTADLGTDNGAGATSKYTKPLYIPPNASSVFRTRIYQVFPTEQADVFVSIYATDRIKLTIECPEELDVNVLFAHRQHSQVKRRNEFTKQGWRKRVWEFDRAMLPYQPIIYRWWKAT